MLMLDGIRPLCLRTSITPNVYRSYLLRHSGSLFELRLAALTHVVLGTDGQLLRDISLTPTQSFYHANVDQCDHGLLT